MGELRAKIEHVARVVQGERREQGDRLRCAVADPFVQRREIAHLAFDSRLARQFLGEKNEIDVRIVVQRLHTPDVFFGSQRALRIEGVGGVRVGERFAQARGRLGCEGRELDAETPGGFRHQRFERARIGHDADTAAARPPHAGKIGGGFDHVFERVDAHDSHVAREGIEHIGAAGERPGVGECRLARFLGSARLDDDEALAIAARLVGSGEKSARIDDGFDVAGDDAQIGIVGEIIDIVRECEPDLVAAGNQIGERQSRIDEAAAERLRQHAALGQGGDTDPAPVARSAHPGKVQNFERPTASPMQFGPTAAMPEVLRHCRSRRARSRPVASPPSPKPAA